VFGNLDVTKSDAVMRTVPLGGTLVAALKEWKARTAFSCADDPVFSNVEGGYTRHGNMIKRKFRPILDELAATSPGKFKRFGWHALRHYAISTWIEAGLTPKTVQTFAGHSTLTVTMDRYGHLFPSEDHREVMGKIATALFSTAHEWRT
jgi:integrase